MTASYVGYDAVTQEIELNQSNLNLNLDLTTTTKQVFTSQIVVTGTKTFKRQTDSPVIVNVINSETLDNVQACNLSEGLKFQPGLRVETCLLYTSPSPRDATLSRMPSSA